MSQPRVVESALPLNTTKPLPQGANNIYTAGVITHKNDVQQQVKLTQNGGIRKKRKSRCMKGGNASVASNSAPVVVVSAAPSYDPNPDATNSINTQLAGLANITASEAALDKTVGEDQAAAAAISAQQQQQYFGSKGGSRIRRKLSQSKHKKGGSFPKWQCLSGGKKSKRHTKKYRYKRRKTHNKLTKRH